MVFLGEVSTFHSVGGNPGCFCKPMKRAPWIDNEILCSLHKLIDFVDNFTSLAVYHFFEILQRKKNVYVNLTL
jgi:hypothetical protein